MKRWFMLVLALALGVALAWLFAKSLSTDPNKRDTLRSNVSKAVSFSAPVFERYQAAYGESLSFDAQAIKQPVIINFWASWCGPCYEEAPELERAWQHHQDKVLFIGINTQDRNRDDANKFLDDFALSFPNVIDNNSRISIDYGTFGLPETFFIKADGSLSYKHAGALSVDVLEREIAKLVN